MSQCYTREVRWFVKSPQALLVQGHLRRRFFRLVGIADTVGGEEPLLPFAARGCTAELDTDRVRLLHVEVEQDQPAPAALFSSGGQRGQRSQQQGGDEESVFHGCPFGCRVTVFPTGSFWFRR